MNPEATSPGFLKKFQPMFHPPPQGLDRTLPTIPGEKGVVLQGSALPDGHRHGIALPGNGVIPGSV